MRHATFHSLDPSPVAPTVQTQLRYGPDGCRGHRHQPSPRARRRHFYASASAERPSPVGRDRHHGAAAVTPSIIGSRSREMGRIATDEPLSSSSIRCRNRATSSPSRPPPPLPPPPPPPPNAAVDDVPVPPNAAARWLIFICLISRRSSLISRTRETFSCIIRMLSLRCSSMFLFSFRFSDSTDFSRYSRCRVYSAAMSESTARETTVSVTCRWYIFFTASLRALGSWMCCTVSCSSVLRPRTFASWSPSLVRCA
mmetsp:Transcript_12088/g.20633  ORF Transcript_12088/g.20633 Transcript_12088/m.20633 type:complete len:255 (-) Transcript_12088:1534-2298(-)